MTSNFNFLRWRILLYLAQFCCVLKKNRLGPRRTRRGMPPPKSGLKLKGGRPDHSPPKTANASARLAWNRRSAARYGALKVRSGEMLPFFARRLLLLMMINAQRDLATPSRLRGCFRSMPLHWIYPRAWRHQNDCRVRTPLLPTSNRPGWICARVFTDATRTRRAPTGRAKSWAS